MGEHEHESAERQAEQEQQQYPEYAERDERAAKVGLPREDDGPADPHERGAS